MSISKNVAVNRIADDCLLVYPDAHKASLVSALSEFDNHSIDEIYSFNDRIRGLDRDKKRKVLEELPEEYSAEIEKMLEAYSSEIQKANEEYYNAYAPHLSDAEYDILTKLLRITLRQKKLWAAYFK